MTPPNPSGTENFTTWSQALRNGRIEASDTVRGHNTTIWPLGRVGM